MDTRIYIDLDVLESQSTNLRRNLKERLLVGRVARDAKTAQEILQLQWQWYRGWCTQCNVWHEMDLLGKARFEAPYEACPPPLREITLASWLGEGGENSCKHNSEQEQREHEQEQKDRRSEQEKPKPPEKWRQKLYNRCPQCKIETLNIKVHEGPKPNEEEHIIYSARACGCDKIKELGF